jgi:ketosteroid isomerase-like protein
MKYFMLLLFCLLYLSSCTQKNEDRTEQLKQELVNADLAMSDLATKDGFFRALNHNAAEDFVKLNEGTHPVVGKKEFEEIFKDKPGTKSLTWVPVKADVSQSGDLGYTWGNWKMVLKDTTVYGNYFTVWKKQEDGSWKMTLDGGNSTPAPN